MGLGASHHMWSISAGREFRAICVLGRHSPSRPPSQPWSTSSTIAVGMPKAQAAGSIPGLGPASQQRKQVDTPRRRCQRAHRLPVPLTTALRQTLQGKFNSAVLSRSVKESTHVLNTYCVPRTPQASWCQIYITALLKDHCYPILHMGKLRLHW